jgi:hypothetical protein
MNPNRDVIHLLEGDLPGGLAVLPRELPELRGVLVSIHSVDVEGRFVGRDPDRTWIERAGSTSSSGGASAGHTQTSTSDSSAMP